MSKPAISIVIRTSRRPGLLRRALESVRVQTFSDWEIVLVNDGGAVPAVTEVVESVFGQDKRIIRINNAKVEGRWPAANAGAKAASGDFITLLDDDDTWHPEFLERTSSFLSETSHAAYIAVAAERVEIQERLLPDGTFEFVSKSASLAPLPPIEVSLADLIAVRNVAVHSLLIRREAFNSIGGYDVSLPVAGDWLHNLRLASLGRIGVISEPLANYHHRIELSQSPDANSVSSGLHSIYVPLIKDRALNASLTDEPWLLGLLLWQKDRFDELNSRIHLSAGELTQHINQTRNSQVSEISAILSEQMSALHAQLNRIESRLNGISRDIEILKVAQRVWNFGMPVRRLVARVRRRKSN
ncbi:MAG: glycosyltransferase family 2 protein [Afipia sp.]